MKLTVTADDFGLTRAVTDSILETFDTGALTRVSLLPNGLAFEYAVSTLASRPSLELSVHFNLTEGKALSDPESIPYLVHPDGTFRYSPMTLLLRTISNGSLRGDIARELSAQLARVRSQVGGRELYADGHQHVHMVPAVFSELAALNLREPFAGIRIPLEPMDWRLAYSNFPKGVVRHLALNIFAVWHRRKLPNRSVFFIGTLMSGRLTVEHIHRTLAKAVRSGADVVEIGTHPGSAAAHELGEWTGDLAWHYSPWRAKERAMLVRKDFPHAAFSPVVESETARIGRFIVSGTAAFLLQLALFIAMLSAGLWYPAAAGISWMVAFAISFSLQKWWTFKDASSPMHKAQVAKYFLLQFGNAILNALFVYVFVQHFFVLPVASQVIAAALLAVWTYGVSRLAIFNKKDVL